MSWVGPMLTPRQLYETVLRMRLLEEGVGEAVQTGEIHGEMHLGIGQEMVSAVMGQYLQPRDAVVSTHRPHLHALAKGVDPVQMLAELLERAGLNGGKGGHMHLFDPVANFMCTGIVGSGAPIAAGYALHQKLVANGGLTVAVVGEGAMNQGAVLETMNLAAVQSLPMVFLCENNEYGISVPRTTSTAGNLVERGSGFGIEGWECDGIDPRALDDVFSAAFTETRDNSRPTLIVAHVYRFRGHYEGDTDHYRPAQEKETAFRERDPLSVARRELASAGWSDDQVLSLDDEVATEVACWFDAARSLPFPDPSDALLGTFVDG